MFQSALSRVRGRKLTCAKQFVKKHMERGGHLRVGGGLGWIFLGSLVWAGMPSNQAETN